MTIEFQKRYWITPDLAKDLTKLANAMYAESNPEAEINNPKPLFEAIGLKKPLSMAEKMDRLFRGPRGLIEQMYEQGEETPEEMNDLHIEDDIDPVTPYEVHEMTAEEPLQRPEPVDPQDAGQVNPENNPSAAVDGARPADGATPN